MPKLDGGIVIHRPASEVFAYATSAESHLQWVPGMQSAKYLDDEPLHVGTQWEAKVSFGGLTVDSIMELTEFVPERRFAWRSVQGPLRSSGGYSFTPLNPAATRFDYEFVTEDRLAMLGAFALPVALRLLRREVRGRLERVKHSLEAGEIRVA